jgi:hypothetical protein
MARVSTGGPFPAIRPDETDFFTFDFSRKLGATGNIVSAEWTCVISPSSPPAVTDPDPQGHVTPQPIASAPVPPATGPQVNKIAALCGGFIAEVVYTLTAVATVDDERVLALSGDIKCATGVSPADEAFTVEQFRADYPAFGDASRFTDEEVQYWIDQACSPPNSTPAINKYRWGQFYDLGLHLWVAHNLAVQDMMNQRAGLPGMGGPTYISTPLTGSGVPASKSVDGVSLSYDNQIGLEKDAGWWGSTPWGNQFLYYLRMAGAAPIQL